MRPRASAERRRISRVRRCLLLSLLAVVACTSDEGDQGAAPSTTRSTAPSTTAIAPDLHNGTEVEPRPVDGDDLAVGHSYEYEFNDHCAFRAISERLSGSYWITDLTYDWPDVERRLAGKPRGSYGVLGVLSRTSEDQLTFEVPDTGVRISYERTTEAVPCF